MTHFVWARGAVSVFEALMVAIAFAALVVTILSFNHKK